MPTVPQYGGPQVQARALPGARQSSVASASLFGAGGRQQAEMGNALMQVGQAGMGIAVDMQERENADRLFRAETALKEDYLGFERSVKERKGQNAWGVTDEAEKWFAKAEQTHAENLTNDAQRHLFAQQLAKLRQTSVGAIANYEAGERRRSLEESASASIVGSIDTAAASAGSGDYTPALQASTKSDIARRVQVVSQLNGWGPERRAFEEQKHLTDLHKQVINAMLESNPEGARAYYKTNKQEIAGTARAGIEATLEAAGTAQRAQAAVDEITGKGLSLSQALTEARKRFSGKDEDAVVSRLKVRYAEQDTAVRKFREDNADEAWSILANGGSFDQIPPSTWTVLDGKTQMAITRYSEAKAKNGNVPQDSRAWAEFRGMAPADMAKMSTSDYYARYRNHFDNAHFDRGLSLLAQYRDAANKPSGGGSYSATLTFDQRMKHTAMQAGIIPAGKTPAKWNEDQATGFARLEDISAQRLATFEGDNKRKATPKEMQEIIDGVVLDMVKTPGALYGSNPANVNLLDQEQMRSAFVEAQLPDGSTQRVNFSDIPNADRALIAEALRAGGRPITEQAIADLWAKRRYMDQHNMGMIKR